MADRLFPHLENYQLTFGPPLSSEQINEILTRISPISYQEQIKEGETLEQLLDRLSKKYEEPYEKWEYARKKVEPQVWRILAPDSQGNKKPYTSGFMRYVWENGVIDNPDVKRRVLRRLAAIGNIFIESIKKKYSPEMADKIIKTIFRKEIDPNALVILDFEFGQLLARLNKRIEEKGIGIKKDPFYGEIDTFTEGVEEEIAEQEQLIQFEPFESFFFNRSEDDQKKILEGLQIMQEIGWLGHPKVRALMDILKQEPYKIDALGKELSSALKKVFEKGCRSFKFPVEVSPISRKPGEFVAFRLDPIKVGTEERREALSFLSSFFVKNNRVYFFGHLQQTNFSVDPDVDVVRIDDQLTNAEDLINQKRKKTPISVISIYIVDLNKINKTSEKKGQPEVDEIKDITDLYPGLDTRKIPGKMPLFFQNLPEDIRNNFVSLMISVFDDGRIKMTISYKDPQSGKESPQLIKTKEVILSQGEMADLICLINSGVSYDLNKIEEARSEARNNAAAEFIRQLESYQIPFSDWEYFTDQKKAEIWNDFIVRAKEAKNDSLATILNYFQDQQKLKTKQVFWNDDEYRFTGFSYLPTEIIQALDNLLNNHITTLPVELREFVEKYTDALNQLTASAEKESEPQKKSKLQNLAAELTQWNQHLTDEEKGLLIALFPSLELPEKVLRYFAKGVAARKRRKEVDLMREQQERAKKEKEQAKLEEEKRKREILAQMRQTEHGDQKLLALFCYVPSSYKWNSISPEELNKIVQEIGRLNTKQLKNLVEPIIKIIRVALLYRDNRFYCEGLISGYGIKSIPEREMPQVDDDQLKDLLTEFVDDPNQFFAFLTSPQNPPDETKAGNQ